jgi:hypothetical protein
MEHSKKLIKIALLNGFKFEVYTKLILNYVKKVLILYWSGFNYIKKIKINPKMVFLNKY